MKHTGGTWDRNDWPRYFIAGALIWVDLGAMYARDALVAVNELNSQSQVDVVHGMIARGCNVFLDSGVYNLAAEHAREHNLSHDEALNMAPDDIDGFDALFKRYVDLCTRFGDGLWGAVEIDQGGRDNKIKTRARLEALGLRPIPVYHPFGDGWDYFDDLAQNYDRICFGNVVQADPATRKRLVATAWERRRKYPHLWIHMLGLTPYGLTVAFPANSCDSSTWLSAQRWGSMPTWAATQQLWSTQDDFTYERGVDTNAERGSRKSVRLSGYDAAMVGRTMRRIAADQRRELGCEPGGFL